jgi:hypothetical protein
MLTILSTSLIGFFGAFIAYQQWRVAEIRLRHDTYERKFKIYEAAKTLLVVFQYNGKLTVEDYLTYLRGITDAEFIYDDPDVTEYLQTLREQANELIRLQEQKAADQSAEVGQWFLKQFGVLRSKFHPSMRLHPPSLLEKSKLWLDAEYLISKKLRGRSPTWRI